MCDRPIGIFDSGIGGLSVLAAAARALPDEKFIYLADSAHMPYGERSAAEIRRYALYCADVLYRMDCKAIVVACNTATENAIAHIRDSYSGIVTIGLEPAVKPCLAQLGGGYAVALVTPATARSQRFAVLASDGRVVISPQPELARRIEGADDIKELRPYIKDILSPYSDAEAVILGCSHYSFIAGEIRRFYGGNIKIYDGAAGAARQLVRSLERDDLLAPPGSGQSIRFYSTQKGVAF